MIVKFLLLFVLVGSVIGYEIEGRIAFRKHLANGTATSFAQMSKEEERQYLADIVVHCYGNRVQYTAFVYQNGSFVFTDVVPGAYFVEVESPSLKFPRVQLSVSKKYDGRVKAKYFENGETVSYPLKLYPFGYTRYFEEVRPLGLLALITGNKMIWFGGFTVLLMFVSKQMQGSEAMQEVVEAPDAFEPIEQLSQFHPQ